MFLEQEPMYCPVQGNSKSILWSENFLYWILRTTSDTPWRLSVPVLLDWILERSILDSRTETFERRLAEGLVPIMKRSWIT